jgi:hypothetical protein
VAVAIRGHLDRGVPETGRDQFERKFKPAVERAFRTGAESPEAAARMALARLR